MARSLRGDEDLERDDDLDEYPDEDLGQKRSEDKLNSPLPDSTSSERPDDEDEVSRSVNKQDHQASEPKTNLDSKFFAVRTAGGQENIVANIIQNRINAKKIGIHSILILDNFKGYIIVEAPDSNIAYEALAGVRHVRGQIRGELPFKDIEGYLVKKPVVSDLGIDD